MPSVDSVGQGGDGRGGHSSVDTIGSCSLDVQANTAASTIADFVDGSEATLCSLDQRKTIASEGSSSVRDSYRSPPSYLGIACAVSGYSSINRYDSAVRKGFRSRDSSPAPPRLAFTRSRDSSPLRDRLKSPETKSTPQETAVRISELKAQLARCAQELGAYQIEERSRQNSIRRRDQKPPSGRSVSVDRGYLTKASLITTGASYRGQDRDRYLGTSPRHSAAGYSSAISGRQDHYRGGNMTSHQIPVRLLDAGQQNFNGHLVSGSPLTLHSRTIDTTIDDTRSFIQERIERLYGPGALAAGFIKRSPGHNMGNAVRRTVNARSTTEGRVIPIQLEYDAHEVDSSKQDREPIKGLPSVFRHLRPEFRHQLPVKSPTVAKTIMKKSDSAESNGHIPTACDDIIVSPESRPAANVVPSPQQDIKSTLSSSSPNGAINGTSNNRHINNSTSISNTLNKGHTLETKVNGSSNQCDSSIKLNGSSNSKVYVPEISCKNKRTSEISEQQQRHNGCSASLLKSSNKVAPEAEAADTAGAVTQINVKDGHHFLKIVAATVAGLEAKVVVIDAELEQHSGAMTEEVRGKVFAGTGKTKLLISQKIKQFTGLCHKNIAGQQGGEEFPTTCEDLEGFWDMVSLQVLEVHILLDNLEAIRQNGWKELPSVDTADYGAGSSKSSGGRKPVRVKPAPSAASKAKDVARKKAAEDRRKALREAMKAKRAAAQKDGEDGKVHIFVPEN